ncbi:protein of unknown function [Paraburkholderia dioscoreae]|uniref:Uncharacterized protein n=1 Tax=Paraburkholderia dioscoreae TaxID=2604047 RepID=A0A5Q4Z1I5_9BURK|nr:protein of unknown function [Paraburkholderia dioscoreae]
MHVGASGPGRAHVARSAGRVAGAGAARGQRRRGRRSGERTESAAYSPRFARAVRSCADCCRARGGTWNLNRDHMDSGGITTGQRRLNFWTGKTNNAALADRHIVSCQHAGIRRGARRIRPDAHSRRTRAQPSEPPGSSGMVEGATGHGSRGRRSGSGGRPGTGSADRGIFAGAVTPAVAQQAGEILEAGSMRHLKRGAIDTTFSR